LRALRSALAPVSLPVAGSHAAFDFFRNPRNDLVHVIFDLVLPEANYRPPFRSQKACDRQVAALVPLDLLRPEGGVRSWPHSVSQAAMPEAAVDENRHPSDGEHNIGAAGDAIVDAITQPPRPKGLPHGQFGLRIRAPYPRHTVTSLTRCQNIHLTSLFFDLAIPARAW
jgi:hypothetical protein